MFVDGIASQIFSPAYRKRNYQLKGIPSTRLTEHTVSCPEDNPAFDFQMKKLDRKAIEAQLQDSSCLSLAVNSLSREVATLKWNSSGSFQATVFKVDG
jgi:hypothetical protein